MTKFAKELADLICCEILPGSLNRLGGVNWWCDNCDSLLNEQPGFSDMYTRWVCTECGYENEISEDNILDEDEY